MDSQLRLVEDLKPKMVEDFRNNLLVVDSKVKLVEDDQ